MAGGGSLTPMRSYWLLLGLMSGIFLALFGLVQALDIAFLADPGPWLSESGRWGAAATGVALLVADVFLPVPASLIMVAHGALFGVAGGTLLSLAGGMAAASVGFAFGRWGSASLHRWVPEDERRRADALLRQWGDLAIVVTRPIPILAESVAILAGTSPLGWRRFLLASAAGTLPAALLYALTGATAARLDSAFLMFGLVMLVAALVWLGGRRLSPP
ncbi:MAG TPA: VTT domain-containing protein [Thermoanaerobaculia bacterium]|nr:VTT domain-containing protein [Thermoanaerobaculia bacterium]